MDRNLSCLRGGAGIAVVALRKESVDRNMYEGAAKVRDVGRSPQGERG